MWQYIIIINVPFVLMHLYKIIQSPLLSVSEVQIEGTYSEDSTSIERVCFMDIKIIRQSFWIVYWIFYHVFWFAESDDLLEDINQPLRVQNYDVVEGGLVFRKTSKVNDTTEVMVEDQHCFKVFINLQRNSHVSDLFNIPRIHNTLHLRIKLLFQNTCMSLQFINKTVLYHSNKCGFWGDILHALTKIISNINI